MPYAIAHLALYLAQQVVPTRGAAAATVKCTGGKCQSISDSATTSSFMMTSFDSRHSVNISAWKL
jgi:hypothetical protein